MTSGADFKATLATLSMQSRIRELTESARKRDNELAGLRHTVEQLHEVIAELRKPLPKPVSDDFYYMRCDVYANGNANGNGNELRLTRTSRAELIAVFGFEKDIEQRDQQILELDRRLFEALHQVELLTQQLADWKRGHWEGPL